MKHLVALFAVVLALWSTDAKAGVFELGGAFSYQHNTYNGGSFTWTKTYSLSFGYYFTADSEVEFSYQDSTNEEFVPGVSDITYRDRVYSINFVYYLVDDTNVIRPYVRAGLGQLNRDATGSYQGGYSAPGRLDQVTVIGGVGLKAKLSGHFGLKAEAVTYLSGGSVATWKDNISLSFGGSYYF